MGRRAPIIMGRRAPLRAAPRLLSLGRKSRSARKDGEREAADPGARRGRVRRPGRAQRCRARAALPGAPPFHQLILKDGNPLKNGNPARRGSLSLSLTLSLSPSLPLFIGRDEVGVPTPREGRVGPRPGRARRPSLSPPLSLSLSLSLGPGAACPPRGAAHVPDALRARVGGDTRARAWRGAPLAPGTPGREGLLPGRCARPCRRARRGSGARPGRGASRGRVSLPAFAARIGAPLPIRGGSRRGMPINYEKEREREREGEGEGERKRATEKLSEINPQEIVTHIHYIRQIRCDISHGILQRRQHIPAALQVAGIRWMSTIHARFLFNRSDLCLVHRIT